MTVERFHPTAFHGMRTGLLYAVTRMMSVRGFSNTSTSGSSRSSSENLTRSETDQLLDSRASEGLGYRVLTTTPVA